MTALWIILGYLVLGLCVARFNAVWVYRKTVTYDDEFGFWWAMAGIALSWPLIGPAFGIYVLGKGVAWFIRGPVTAEKAKLKQMIADRDAWRGRLDNDDPMNDAARELVTVLTDQINAKRRKLGVGL